jgi:hypothetical protein
MKRALLLLFSLLITGAVLSAATVYMAANYGKAKQGDIYGLIIVAEELSGKPQTYFSLNNPDSYVSQAISNPGEVVLVGKWGNSKIKDIADNYGTGTSVNIEYNSHYYHVALGSADPSPAIDIGLIPWLILGWILWCASIVAAVVVLFYRKRSNKTKA